ncbi:MAG: cysteine desulfurase [Deltaproteobacteria bacterium]|nr:cysteine desulfurase [Deltaproteobacteria bacterium]
MTFDVAAIRRNFPVLHQQVYGKPLVYLDNAATSQAPRSVIEAMNKFYLEYRSNVHRGVYHLSERATVAYEGSRVKVQKFLNAASDREIIFTRGTTEGINLVAHSYGRKFLKDGDEIVISHMEHHSNIVPWQLICEATGAKLRVAPINDKGELIFEEYEKLLGPKTRFVSVVHVSNSLGTVNPVKKIIDRAHQAGAKVLLDGAQAVPHMPVDVQALDCDFYAFSGHKVFGGTGIGVLYGKSECLNAMPPYQGGGDMIRLVTFEKTTYNDLPYKFEAGTPNIAGAIGLGAAIDYLDNIDFQGAGLHERELLSYGESVLSAIPSLKLIGVADRKVGILSFVLENIHPHDIATILDREGIAIRAGHHCTQPVMQRFNVPATSRASLAFYNTKEEIDALVKGIEKVIEMFK